MGSTKAAWRQDSTMSPHPSRTPAIHGLHGHLTARARQRGITLLGLLAWVALLGFALVIAFQAVPVVVEEQSVYALVQRSIQEAPDHNAIRETFTKGVEAGYISDISADDLRIHTHDGVTTVSYQLKKVIHLVGPVSLELKYDKSVSK